MTDKEEVNYKGALLGSLLGILISCFVISISTPSFYVAHELNVLINTIIWSLIGLSWKIT